MIRNADSVRCPDCGKPTPKDAVLAVLSEKWHYCPDCSMSFIPAHIDYSGAE